MKYFVQILLLLCALNLQAQTDFNASEYNVSRNDLITNHFENDSTAGALVIYEKGYSYIDKHDFRLKTEIKKKIKILNANGFGKATVAIYLYYNKRNKEKISNIRAITYNLDGEKVSTIKLEDDQIYTEAYNKNHTAIKFTLPAIKEGSVITYSYELDTPFIYKYRPWNFQSDIPKLYSEYITSIPGNYEYNAKLVGGLKFSDRSVAYERECLKTNYGASANCNISTYKMENIPAFIEESYITAKQNYLSRIEYELEVYRGFDGRIDNISKTWKDADKEFKLNDNLGHQLGKGNYAKTLLTAQITNADTPLQKAQNIYKYVQDTYTWNNSYSKEVKVKDLVSEKSGNVKEINILLHNLLENEGFKVYPVLSSTRKNGFPTKLYPIITDFNYLIVQVEIDGKTYLLDATDKYLDFGMLPFRCLNLTGRLLDFKNGSRWIDIEANKMSIVRNKVELSLNKNQELSGTISSVNSGYHALPLKKSYFESSENYLKYFENTYPNIQFLDHSVSTENQTSFDFKETFTVNSQLETIGGNIYLNPFLFKVISENPFKLQERTYPIDFGYKDAYLYSFEIKTDGYDVVEIPKDLNLSLPNGKGTLIFTTKQTDNSVMIYFKFNFTDAIYGASYYSVLKAYMGKIVDIQKNSLILLKKKS
ncbi:DUF3857 domain-containing protein [Lacinutrix undariae]